MSRIIHWLQGLITHTYFPIGMLIITNLAIGSLIVNDYGESWDEQVRMRYAEKSLDAYLGDIRTLGDEKGAFYVMVAKLGSEALRRLLPSWASIDGWHFMHFLSFQASLLFFYMICLRFASKWAATGATLLFSTQPLLWGHAFINPKDIPFMAFFLASVALGMQMVSSLADMDLGRSDNRNAKTESEIIAGKFYRDWENARGRRLKTAGIISGISIAVLIGLFLGDGFMRDRISHLVYQAYNAETPTLLNLAFARLAENMQTLPAENYVNKAFTMYTRFISFFVIVTVTLNVVVVLRLFPSTAMYVWSKRIRPYFGLIGNYMTSKHVILAGIFLGLSASIRVLGPASGFLIAAFWLIKTKRKAIPGIIAYFLIATVVTYIAWPYLWGAPLSNFLQSFLTASDFGWSGKVLFQGVDHGAPNLPRSYLPVLLGLQFTETAWVIFAIGLITISLRLIKNQIDKGLAFLAAAWLFLPVLGVVMLRPIMYDNFRHFLFIVPPIFIIACVGIEVLTEKLNNFRLSILLLILLILPGIFWIINLHPYQYVYYNALTGWTGGAFQKYEMDYWATSYREAMLNINEVAPENARVIVWGPDHVVNRYARPDLRILAYDKEVTERSSEADFLIVSTRYKKDEELFPNAPIIYQVGREGAVFAVVKQLK
ncbi:MAG TPA: hypothetical protein VFZ76_02655 [Anaerolineales bacterium]